MGTPIPPVLLSKTPEIDKSGPIRLHVDQAIQAAINRAVLPLPDDATTAKVVFEGNIRADGTKEVGIAYLGRKRINDGTLTWELAGVAGVGGEWGQHLNGGAKATVAYAWGAIFIFILGGLC